MRNKRILKIIKHYGYQKQIEKLKEESAEFLEDPCVSEIADIYNVVTGIYYASKSVRDMAKSKQIRTLERIRTIPDYF